MSLETLKTRLAERLEPVDGWRPDLTAHRSDFDLNPKAARTVKDLRPAAVLIPVIARQLLVAGQFAFNIGEVGEFSVQTADSWNLLAQLCEKFVVAKGRKGRSAAQDQHLRDSLGRGVL